MIPADQMRERDGLLDELARLISLVGYGDFLFGPIVLAEDQFFPDKWSADIRGARKVLGRLMTFARLGSIQTRLRHDRDPTWETDDGDEYVPPHRDAAAWFAGANEFGAYLFGVRESQLESPLMLTGILAHETAHAWRFRRDIMNANSATEEGLTDLTTVFLGFGVLRASIASLGDTQLRERGYLPMFSVCFSLGVQLALRNVAAERRTVEGALPYDQRVMVSEIADLYSSDREALIDRLRLPPEAQWVRPRPVKQTPATSEQRPVSREIVFRVRAPPFLEVGAISIVLSAAFAAGLGVPWPLLAPLVITPIALVVKRDRCSGSDCGRVLRKSAAVCPACGGKIVGRIARMAERDEAERRFLETDDEVSEQARMLARDLLRRE